MHAAPHGVSTSVSRWCTVPHPHDRLTAISARSRGPRVQAQTQSQTQTFHSASERGDAPMLAFVGILLVALGPAAAVLQMPLPIVFGVGGVLAMIILASRPDIATLLVVAIVYSNAAVVAVRFHDVPFTLAAGTPLLLALPLGWHLLIRRQPLVLPRAVPWIAGYLLAMLLSAALARDAASAAEAVGIFVTEGFLLYLLIVNCVRTQRMAVALVCILVALAAVLSVLSIHQLVTDNFSSNYLGFAQVGGTGSDVLTGVEAESRTAGPFGRANRYAQILVLVLPLVFTIVWARLSRITTLLAMVAGILMSIATALTLSRGAAVGFAMVLFVMVVLRYIRLGHIAIVAVAVIGLFLAVPGYGDRLDTLSRVPGLAEEGVEADGSVRSRITEMIAAALVFIDHPVLGVGPGQFPVYYIEYAEKFGLRVRAEDREAHNLYFGLAADVGIVGSVFFLGATGVTMADLYRVRKRLINENPVLAHLAAGLMLSILTYLTTGLFLHLAFERYLWMMMALGSAVALLARQQPAVEPTRVAVALRPRGLPGEAVTGG